MSELLSAPIGSPPRSWKYLYIGISVGAATTGAMFCLLKYLKSRYVKPDYSQLHDLRDGHQLLTFNSSRPATPVQGRRPEGTAHSTPRHADVGPGNSENGARTIRGDDQNLLHVLYSMAEDQARRESYVHRGISCNLCNASPLCGNRFKCASCIDYDICERCEPHDRHNRTHVFIKIKIPIPPLANPRNVLLKPFYPGKDLHRRKPTLDEMQGIKSASYFDQNEIDALYDQYRTLCTKDRGITRDVFDQCLGPLGMEKNLVMDRLFKFYDANCDGYIDFKEFVRGLSILIKGSQEEKVRYAFEGYDLDGSGFVSRDNLRKMFKAYFYVTIELVRDVVKACEEEMMANFDDTQGRPISSLFSAPIPSTDTGTLPNQTSKIPFPGNPGSREDMWPVMEAMSQDAIEEMVENVFKMATVDKDQGITLQQFLELTAVDSSLLAWFDALGTVF